MTDAGKIMAAAGLAQLVGLLQARGFEVWAAREQAGALSLQPIDSAAALPRGLASAGQVGRAVCRRPAPEKTRWTR